MIVKDEKHVIERCLASVKPLIDYWVIVDTGSTDGTQQIIRNFLKDIPGELHERPWVNFAHNRNEALTLARGKAEYFLFIDADDRLVFEKNFKKTKWDKDHYYVIQKAKDPASGRVVHNYHVLLIKDLPEFRWEGAVHEILLRRDNMSYEILNGVYNEYLHDGARSKDPEKFAKDIRMLKKSLHSDPGNTRNVFYLAQTYRAVNLREAIAWFEKRASMGGEPSEVFYSLYIIGVLQRSLKMDELIFLKSLSQAYVYRPSRAEPLYEMGQHYLEKGNPWLASLLAKFALDIPLPKNELFVETWMYEHGFKQQMECACRSA